jgi:hypothetical protein
MVKPVNNNTSSSINETISDKRSQTSQYSNRDLSTLYPSYNNIPRPSYLGNSYNSLSQNYGDIEIGINPYDLNGSRTSNPILRDNAFGSVVYSMPGTPRLSNLSTPSGLSEANSGLFPTLSTREVPKTPQFDSLSISSGLSEANPGLFPKLSTRPIAPRPSNLTTPSSLSEANSQVFPKLNYREVPKTPQFDNLSTSSGLSEVNPNLFFRPLNPVSKNATFGNTQSYPVSGFNGDNYYTPAGVPGPMPDNFNPYNQVVTTNSNRDYFPTAEEFAQFRYKIIDRYNNNGLSSKIVLLENSKGKFELNFDFMDLDFTKLKKVCIKYHDLSKRKLM